MTAVGVATVIVSAGLLVGSLVWGVHVRNRAIEEARRFDLLAARADTVPGRVTYLRKTGRRHASYYIEYEFADAAGVSRRTEQKVSRNFYGGQFKGKAIRVEYVPGEPSVSRPVYSPQPIASTWDVVAVPALLLAVVAFFAHSMMRQRQLLMLGGAAVGRVTHVRGGRGGPYVTYSFSANGVGWEGKGPANRRPAIREEIVVLYDPDRPNRNLPYPVRAFDLEAEPRPS